MSLFHMFQLHRHQENNLLHVTDTCFQKILEVKLASIQTVRFSLWFSAK